MKRVLILTVVLAVGCTAPVPPEPVLDLSPATWQADYDRYMQRNWSIAPRSVVATGSNGAVTVGVQRTGGPAPDSRRSNRVATRSTPR